MGLNLHYIEGQSPLDEDEKEGLKIRTISTRAELDEFEQANIEMAVKWSIARKFYLGMAGIQGYVRTSWSHMHWHVRSSHGEKKTWMDQRI